MWSLIVLHSSLSLGNQRSWQFQSPRVRLTEWSTTIWSDLSLTRKTRWNRCKSYRSLCRTGKQGLRECCRVMISSLRNGQGWCRRMPKLSAEIQNIAFWIGFKTIDIKLKHLIGMNWRSLKQICLGKRHGTLVLEVAQRLHHNQSKGWQLLPPQKIGIAQWGREDYPWKCQNHHSKAQWQTPCRVTFPYTNKSLTKTQRHYTMVQDLISWWVNSTKVTRNSTPANKIWTWWILNSKSQANSTVRYS